MMFVDKNTIKKFSILVVSLGLVAPLAINDINNNVASAKVRTHRVAKIHRHHIKHLRKHARRRIHATHRTKVTIRHAHKYYKFAYNKKEYNTYLTDAKQFHENVNRIESKFNLNKQPKEFQIGMNDALNNNFTAKLGHNANYKKAYELGVNADDSQCGMKDSNSDLNRIYNMYEQHGSCATAPALDQMKNEAYLGTL